MDNQEMLSALSGLLDEKLEPIKSDIRELKTDVAELKSDVAELKSDVANLKSDVAELKVNVEVLNTKVGTLTKDVGSLKSGVAQLNVRMTNAEIAIRDLRLVQENRILPLINMLAENYVPASQRFIDRADQIDDMQADIHTMKRVIREHSEKLQKLA